MTTDVVVTGLGTVNPLGADVPSFWDAALAGRSGIRSVTEFPIPTGMSQVAGVVDLEWPGSRPLSADLDLVDDLDRGVRLAITAAREAVTSAGLTTEDLVGLRPDRGGVSISTAIGGIARMEAVFRADTDGGRKSAALVQRRDDRGEHFFFDTTSALVARSLNIPGEHVSVVTGCTGGIDAVGQALTMLRSGRCDVVVAGAAEAPITPLVVSSFARIGATSLNPDPATASRPWTLGRDGFVLAEGAGMMVLETAEHARRRGALVLAEVAGFGSVNNYFHMTSMPQDGRPLARAADLAIQDAGIDPSDIGVINAHGSSTPMNDVAESNALASVFGSRSSSIPCSSLKSQIGHPLAAANSIELVASVLTLRHEVQPPTLNRAEHDPACRVHVRAEPVALPGVRHLLKTSSGFAGIHSALVLSLPKEEA